MRVKYPTQWVSLLAIAAFTTTAVAQVENCDGSNDVPCVEKGDLVPYKSVQDFFQKFKISGQLRSYYFSRLYGAGSPPDQNAYSLGGLFNIESPSIYGFSAALSFYTANSLGTHNTHDATDVDTTLAGLQSSTNALGQAFAQYKYSDMVKVRAGNQLIDTPWVNPSDSRMIPATYQGFYGEALPLKTLNLYEPLKNLKLSAMRIYSWKSRTSGGYYDDNLYYQTNYDGDPLFGGAPALSRNAPGAPGTAAISASTKFKGANAQIWYYDFYNFANMIHADATYSFKSSIGINPYISGQYVREWEKNSLLNSNSGAGRINGYTGNGINTNVWGARTGIVYDVGNAIIGKGDLSVAYNKLNYASGAVGGGAIISPYTTGYATDPLYTTTMIRGLVEMGPGQAFKVNLTQNFWEDRFRLTLAYGGYSLHNLGYADDEYVDLTYFPKGFMKGFSIRDRMEVAQGAALGGGRMSHFIYNRVMLNYEF
ncbi:MAG: OprD family outer membrane porin [Methylococcales bacterium]|nr:OprD family outer membrane porin [Methylococcales bacterium]